MRTSLLILLCLAALLLVGSATAWAGTKDGYDYTDAVTYAPVDPGAGATPFNINDDFSGIDCHLRINFPPNFRIDYFDVEKSYIWVNNNGYLSFKNSGCTAADYAETSLPSTAGPDGIMPWFWHDSGGGPGWWEIQGTMPNRVFVVALEGWNSLEGNPAASAQIKLFESNSAIEFHMTLINDQVSNVIIGIEDDVGTKGIQYPNAQSTQEKAIRFTPVPNKPPVANDQAVALNEDTAQVVTMTSSDPNSDPVTYTLVSGPSMGTLSGITADKITYTPQANKFGADSFQFKVNDGELDSNVATISLTINPVNDPPTANNDEKTVFEDSGKTNIDVLANDGIAPDTGETLVVQSVTAASSGIVTIASGGGSVEYEPNANFNGDDSFTYTVSDGNGGNAVATVNVEVKPVNDPPVANDDIFTAVQGQSTVMDVIANDGFGVDAWDVLSIKSVTQPGIGSVEITGKKVTYTAPSDGTGSTTFTYDLQDGGGLSDTATVTVNINEVPNLPPNANDDEFFVITTLTFSMADLLANDDDPESGPMTAAIMGTPSKGTFSGSDPVTYTPNEGESGWDLISYQITDSKGQTDSAQIRIRIASPDEAPQISCAVSGNQVARTTLRFECTTTEGSSPITTYHWDFGDGEFSSFPSPSHGYATAGNYLAVGTVTDESGLSASAEISLAIEPYVAPPSNGGGGVSNQGGFGGFNRQEGGVPVERNEAEDLEIPRVEPEPEPVQEVQTSQLPVYDTKVEDETLHWGLAMLLLAGAVVFAAFVAVMVIRRQGS